ncbi:MAG: phosphate-starvation-inducible PsiE family protein [Bacteroidia bacterium]|jgi:uncharacterized membrane protein (DUF373 family)|nr:phosphate-starvation-inducible PsiE family protein [Bacteroidia bacterium]
MEKITKFVLNISIKIITVVLLLMLIYSVSEFLVLFIRAVMNHPIRLESGLVVKESTFLSIVLSLIAAVLLILIILEMIELVKDYHTASKQDYLILVIEIAIVSIVRHLIVLDFSHYEPLVFIGIALILLVMCAFYLMLRYNKRLDKQGKDAAKLNELNKEE